MKSSIKFIRRFLLMLTVGILVCSAFFAAAGFKADAVNTDFVIDAQLMTMDEAVYNVVVTIENNGGDWEGMARLTTVSVYGSTDSCAYDTVLSLPQGSKKQFTVRIPKNSIQQTDGLVCVTLYDKKFKAAASRDFNRLLQGGADVLNMGILSDEYSALTFLDMGGSELYYDNNSYPIKLTELNRENIGSSLNSLDILVIDSYDTSVLTDDIINDIRRWNRNRGALVVGTGSHAAETLAALDYLDMESTSTAGRYNEVATVDIAKLHLAGLRDVNNSYYTAYGTLAFIGTQGNGAVGILPYALTELGSLPPSAYSSSQEEFIRQLLQEIIGAGNGYYGKNGTGYYTVNAGSERYIFENIFELFGNGSNSLHFGRLKVLVIIYVIFVGPVLYLVLRLANRRDFYWWAVPAAALAGIFLIYLAGRGFEVVNTRVYSVAVKNLAGEGEFITYLHCYDADHGEWKLNLAEGFEYAGSSIDNYYGDKNPHYYIRQEGDRFSVGAYPDSNFEDCYFQAAGTGEADGGNIAGSIKAGVMGITGTVANNTNWDFAYFAVIADGKVYIYKNLPKGKVCDLASEKEIYIVDGAYGSAARSYSNDYMREVCRGRDKSDLNILAALGMGIADAYPEGTDKTMIIGVTRDWDKAVDDNCSETAYGCLYTIQ